MFLARRPCDQDLLGGQGLHGPRYEVGVGGQHLVQGEGWGMAIAGADAGAAGASEGASAGADCRYNLQIQAAGVGAVPRPCDDPASGVPAV